MPYSSKLSGLALSNPTRLSAPAIELATYSVMS